MAPASIVSVMTTFVAADGPSFVTVIVDVALAAGDGRVGWPVVFVIRRSAAVVTGFDVSLPTYVSGRRSSGRV